MNSSKTTPDLPSDATLVCCERCPSGLSGWEGEGNKTAAGEPPWCHGAMGSAPVPVGEMSLARES